MNVFVLLSAILTLWGEYRGPRSLVYVFKPLTTICIFLVAFGFRSPEPRFYLFAILAGLVFSLAGDIFLMLPSDRFIAGLVSFLLAHVAYVCAFASVAGRPDSLLAPALFGLYGIALLRALWPHLGSLKVPVIVYALALLVMGWQAVEQLLETGSQSALLAVVGAVLFILSDSALAWNRFAGPFRAAQAVILGTYFTAQWLIALSVNISQRP